MIRPSQLVILMILSALPLTVKAYKTALQPVVQSDSYKLEVELQTLPAHKGDVRPAVTVVLTNTSGTDLTMMRTNPLHDYDILVRDAQGAEVPMTDHGKELVEGQNEVFTHVEPITLKPQDSIKTVINLHDYYELQRGQYVVQVRRHVKATAKKANTITNAASATDSHSWASSPFAIVP